jgi:hypothetical protein
MTKQDILNIAKALPVCAVVLFYWWGTATDFEWKGNDAGMLLISAALLFMVGVLALLLLASPFFAISYFVKNLRKRKS